MSLAKIIYASMTGNTERISEILEKAFKNKGWNVERNEVDEVDADIFDDADICVVATYTYDEGEIPFDFEDFYDELSDKDLVGKIFGVVGSGDSELYSDNFCRAVDKFEKAFKATGAKEGGDAVKINNAADEEDNKRLEQFVSDLINAS